MPHLDTRLCMLLCITTLVVADLIEEESAPLDGTECGSTNHWKEKEVPVKHRNDLVSSLQMLGDYQGLLAPPPSVVSVANQAAAKAMLFISGIGTGNAYFDRLSVEDMPINCCKLYLVVTVVHTVFWGDGFFWTFQTDIVSFLTAGNMLHLIVEACIARNLLDTSAYFWPGYVNGCVNQIPQGMSAQVPGWSSFLKGATLTPLMTNAMVSSPASRYT